MPQPGFRWRFVTINTKNSWHHGNPRGFRSRDHRIHSSGDYRTPPPSGEHEELLRCREARSGPKVILPRPLRPIIAKTFVQELGIYRFNAMSVSSDHAHLLIELPDSPREIRSIIGEVKRVASRNIRDELPGVIWSSGCDYEPVDDVSHYRECQTYVLTKQGAGSWTWSFAHGAMWHEERVDLEEAGALPRRGRR
jgi:REP element-mobilizing transposase RayT